MKPLNKSQHALLGLLTLGPGSGYDLNKLADLSLNHFWRESYGQIYPSLKRLEAAGFVVGSKEAQDGKPDRTVYRITAEGEKVFLAGLREPVAPRPPRNELLLKLFFGTHMSRDEVREHLQSFQRRQQDLFETYQGIEQWLETEQAGKPDLPYWLATVSYGRFEAEAHLRWCEQTLELVKEETRD